MRESRPAGRPPSRVRGAPGATPPALRAHLRRIRRRIHHGPRTSGVPGRPRGRGTVRDLVMPRISPTRAPSTCSCSTHSPASSQPASTILDPTRLRGTVLSAPALRPSPRLPSRACRLAGRANQPRPRRRKGSPRWHSVPRDPQVQRDFDADPLTYEGGVPIPDGRNHDPAGRRSAATRRPPHHANLWSCTAPGDLLADLRGSCDSCGRGGAPP